MSLMSFMEEKQLDFNRPLLSVRKLSSTILGKEHEKVRKAAKDVPKVLAAPAYRSELKSGPVRNAGTVPFLWEQSPGKPKDEKASQNQAIERPPSAPKLPPGRNLDVKQHVLNTRFEVTAAGQSETRHELSRSEHVAHTRFEVKAAGQSETRHELSRSECIAHMEQRMVKDEIFRDVMEEAESSDSEDGTDAYVDALDTLSRSESFLNCSISGVSGLDGPDLKPSQTFLTDPLTRDFMLGRFLPAAKAMASETPQHAARKHLVAQKQLIAQEQPRPRHKVVNVDERQPLNKFRQDNIQYDAHGIQVEESEDDNDSDDYDGLGPTNSSICGLFPRLCLQNSFCLLHPVPGMRKQAQSSMSVPRSTIRTPDTRRGKTEIRRDRNAIYGWQQLNRLQPAGRQENRSVQTSNTNHLINSEKEGGSSLHSCWQGNGTSPYHNGFYPSANQISNVSLATSDKTKNFGGNGSGPCAIVASNFRDLLAKERDERESDMASPVVEKTLYIDSVHLVKPQRSKSTSSDMEGLPGCGKDDAEVLVKDKDNVETCSVHSLLQDIKQLAVAENQKLQPDHLESFDSSYLSISNFHDMQMDVVTTSGQDQDVMQPLIFLTSPKLAPDRNVDLKNHLDDDSDKLQGLSVLNQDLNVSLNEKIADGGKIDLERELSAKPVNAGKSKSSNLLLSLRPPPPKSPSESWLQRTLATVSTRNPSSRSPAVFRLNPGVPASKMSTTDSRGETIVRASNVQHVHLRLSEELLTAIPES